MTVVIDDKDRARIKPSEPNTATVSHADRAHSNLGPSGSSRWMNCPGSVQVIHDFREKYKPKRDAGRNADVGTIAHEMSEAMLLDRLPDRIKLEKIIHEDDEPLSDDEWDEMYGHMLMYRQYVRSLMDEGDLLLLEKRLTMHQIHESVYGTGDVLIYKRKLNKLIVVDLKYGFSPVHAQDNSQLKLYIVGSDNLMIEMGNTGIVDFEAHIYQPRVANGITSASYTRQDIDTFIIECKEAVERIEAGDTTRNPGEKQCQWCNGYGTELCPESSLWVSKEALGLINELEDLDDITAKDIALMKPEDFDVDRLAGMFLMFGAAKKWMSKVEEHLIPIALEGNVDALKIIEGRGSNSCVDPDEVEFIVGEAALKPRQLKSVTDLKKIVGAKRFDDLLGDCYTKNPGKWNLVASSNAAPAVNPTGDLLSELDDLDD